MLQKWYMEIGLTYYDDVKVLSTLSLSKKIPIFFFIDWYFLFI